MDWFACSYVFLYAYVLVHLILEGREEMLQLL